MNQWNKYYATIKKVQDIRSSGTSHVQLCQKKDVLDLNMNCVTSPYRLDGEINVYYRDIMGWFWKTKQPRNPSEKNCQKKKMTKNRIHKTIRKILTYHTYHNVNVQFTPLDIYGTKFVCIIQ